MNDLLLCKPGEIFLKGLNKHYFEERLVANVKRRLKPIGHFRVTYLQSALYIEAADDAADLDAAYDAVRKVFGIATITRAAACEKDKDAITALAKSYLHDAMTAAHSFKVETKRSDKRFPMTSIELSQYVGGELAEAFPNTVVDVHDPELTVRLEVREQAAYVHAQAVEAAGGMPVGCNGAVTSCVQTMEAMACTQDVTHLPVLQPLIGMDKRDIVKIAREIGTFDTSILPYEDCCTVFTPRHPKTRPTVAEVAEAESALDIDALVHEAVDGIERIRIDL